MIASRSLLADALLLALTFHACISNHSSGNQCTPAHAHTFLTVPAPHPPAMSKAATIHRLVSDPFKPLLSGPVKRFKWPVLAHTGIADSLVTTHFAPRDFKDKTVLDINAGVGLISQALVSSPAHRPARILAFEAEERLRPLIAQYTVPHAEKHGVRMSVHAADHMAGSAFFDDLRNSPTMLGNGQGSGPDPALVRKWDQEPVVTLVAALSTKLGDLNVSQLLRWMGGRAGVHEFGRVPVYIFLCRSFSERLIARPGDKQYGRLSGLAQALTHVHMLDCKPKGVREFYPFKTEVDLLRLDPKLDLPFKHCTFEEYEFVLKTLFVNKSIPLKEAIKSLDPTKTSLAKLLPPEFMDRPLMVMDVPELVQLADAFAQWPLKHEFHEIGSL
ncbi:S-adenosyl-L-methionine-dependent methyltransferase [Catenaria anguillulae PL171]|uniref:rRNA adenine N(6)-methyltransferase n=1 Tax=Catenaria anguillulae PL171 TaxID=765915 RepID=A0A1Y2HNJ5_9FUNG|nr:S-adenosyl-L-methionine-dependent methyltransferase [Catenaria anguillulae PL171]